MSPFLRRSLFNFFFKLAIHYYADPTMIFIFILSVYLVLVFLLPAGSSPFFGRAKRNTIFFCL